MPIVFAYYAKFSEWLNTQFVRLLHQAIAQYKNHSPSASNLEPSKYGKYNGLHCISTEGCMFFTNRLHG